MVGIERKTPYRRSNANHGNHHPTIQLWPLPLTVTINSKMRTHNEKILKKLSPPHYANSIMTNHTNFCWNQDECNICTTNHHEIRLVREAETLAKQTNKANTLQQSAQIWSAVKEELICSLCEKTLMTWTPPCWKCSYKWTERIYRTRSIVRYDVSLMRSRPMAELLIY